MKSRFGTYGVYVKTDACKVVWTGTAVTPEEAATKSLSSLGCKSLERLVRGEVLVGVVVRFRLEYHCPDAGVDRSNRDLPLRSGDWAILMESVHTRYFGSTEVKTIFNTLEKKGRRP